MNTIRFEIENVLDRNALRLEEVRILIDETDFRKLLKVPYCGISIRNLDSFLEDSSKYVEEHLYEEMTLFSICSCGEDGCGSVLGRIHIGQETISWEGFRELLDDEDSSYSTTGSFVFDKVQYLRAIEEVSAG
jgi:hypothetical protein